ITAERLDADLGFTDEQLLVLFDPTPSNRHNLRLVEHFRSGAGALVSAVARGTDPFPVPTGTNAQVGEYREVAEADIDLEGIRIRASAASDPEERALLLERANRGHQRALK